MLSKIKFLLLCSIVVFSMSSCSDGDDDAKLSVEKINIVGSQINMVLGTTTKINAITEPVDVSNGELIWKSENDKVATIDEQGLVTAVSIGSTDISVGVKDSNVKSRIKITVTKDIVYVEEIKLTRSYFIIKPGQKMPIYYTTIPENATNKTVVWESSDPKVVTIDQNGVVTGVKDGVSLVRATSLEGAKSSIHCEVHVTSGEINIGIIDLNAEKVTLEVGQTFQLYPTIYPEYADNKDIMWSTFDEDYISVNQSGLVTALKPCKKAIALVKACKSAAQEICYFEIVEKQVSEDFTDVRDGHVYKTVKIGNQTWMAENLAYIPNVNKEDSYDSDGNMCYVQGYDGTNIEEAKKTEGYKKYGVLYGFNIAKKSVPEGWHIPTEEEWQELEQFLGLPVEKSKRSWGRKNKIGYDLKSKSGWGEFGNGSNNTGFDALPGGQRNGYGLIEAESTAYFWSSTTNDDFFAWVRFIDAEHSINRYDLDFGCGASIRCIKNN